MVKLFLRFSLITIAGLFAGCSVVEGVFKAGVWVGILVVVAVIALIIWLVTKSRK